MSKWVGLGPWLALPLLRTVYGWVMLNPFLLCDSVTRMAVKILSPSLICDRVYRLLTSGSTFLPYLFQSNEIFQNLSSTRVSEPLKRLSASTCCNLYFSLNFQGNLTA